MTVFVYVMAPKFSDGPCKIGIAGNVSKRLQDVQIGNPDRLSVFQSYMLESRDIARRIEVLSHQALSRFKLSGEWFDVSKGDALRAVHKSTIHALSGFYVGSAYEDALHEAVTWDA